MMLRDLEPNDDLEVVSTGLQYKYDGYKNYHRLGWIHWVVRGGVKTALPFNTEVNKLNQPPQT